MLKEETWTRVLAMALVLPLAAACAETGEDEIDDTETLETTPTTEMNRVELESFGTEDINGWVTARTEGEEIVLTLNLDQTRMGMDSPTTGTEGETGMSPEGEMGTDPGAMGTEGRMTGEGEMRYSARLIEGMCMDVRPGRDLGQTPTGETATGETDATAESEDVGAGLEQEEVETVAEFEQPDERAGTGADAYSSSPMNARTLEARVDRSEITDQAARSFAVVLEDERMDETEGIDEQDENSNVVACADVTRLVRNSGQPAGTTGQQPMGTEGTERGSEESGSNY